MRHLQVRENKRNGYEGMFCINQKTCILAFLQEHVSFHCLHGAHNASHLDILIKSQSQKLFEFLYWKVVGERALAYFFTRPSVEMPRNPGTAADVHLLLLLLGLIILLVLRLRLRQLYDLFPAAFRLDTRIGLSDWKEQEHIMWSCNK